MHIIIILINTMTHSNLLLVLLAAENDPVYLSPNLNHGGKYIVD